jgi:hypothetical protein
MTNASGEDEDTNGNGSGHHDNSVADREVKRSKGDANTKTKEDINTKSPGSNGNVNNLSITPVHFGSLDVKQLSNE